MGFVTHLMALYKRLLGCGGGVRDEIMSSSRQVRSLTNSIEKVTNNQENFLRSLESEDNVVPRPLFKPIQFLMVFWNMYLLFGRFYNGVNICLLLIAVSSLISFLPDEYYISACVIYLISKSIPFLMDPVGDFNFFIEANTTALIFHWDINFIACSIFEVHLIAKEDILFRFFLISFLNIFCIYFGLFSFSFIKLV